jgi:hypothetical protein
LAAAARSTVPAVMTPLPPLPASAIETLVGAIVVFICKFFS